MRIWLLLIILSAGAAIAVISAIAADSTTSAVAPTTRQDNSSSSQPNRYSQQRQRNNRFSRNNRRDVSVSTNLPTSYEEVATRNIFIRGDQRPPRVDPTSTGSSSYSGVSTPAPTQLVLTGVSLASNDKIAFLEDEDANTVTRVKVGDPISTGKVVGMTLDSLDYKDTGGRTVRVEVGFNLAGGDVWGVSGSSPTTQSSTQPSGSGPRAPGESMEDYLRRRRAAELGH